MHFLIASKPCWVPAQGWELYIIVDLKSLSHLWGRCFTTINIWDRVTRGQWTRAWTCPGSHSWSIQSVHWSPCLSYCLTFASFWSYLWLDGAGYHGLAIGLKWYLSCWLSNWPWTTNTSRGATIYVYNRFWIHQLGQQWVEDVCRWLFWQGSYLDFKVMDN